MSFSKSIPVTSPITIYFDVLRGGSVSKAEHDAIQASMLAALHRNVTEIQKLGPDDPLHDAEM